jgi:hypothetical protein
MLGQTCIPAPNNTVPPAHRGNLKEGVNPNNTVPPAHRGNLKEGVNQV